jgi:hypothetical protein
MEESWGKLEVVVLTVSTALALRLGRHPLQWHSLVTGKLATTGNGNNNYFKVVFEVHFNSGLLQSTH